MNTETGQIYRGQDFINAAIGRGEPVVPVSERVANQMEAGAKFVNVSRNSSDGIQVMTLGLRLGKDKISEGV